MIVTLAGATYCLHKTHKRAKVDAHSIHSFVSITGKPVVWDVTATCTMCQIWSYYICYVIGNTHTNPTVLGPSWILSRTTRVSQHQKVKNTSSWRAHGHTTRISIMLPGCRVVVGPDTDVLVEMMRSKNGRVTSEVVKVVHDDRHKQIQHLTTTTRRACVRHAPACTTTMTMFLCHRIPSRQHHLSYLCRLHISWTLLQQGLCLILRSLRN